MDWMGLEKIEKKFDLFGIQTNPIPLNPHGLRANRTSPNLGSLSVKSSSISLFGMDHRYPYLVCVIDILV
jgi:hypothetical protein